MIWILSALGFTDDLKYEQFVSRLRRTLLCIPIVLMVLALVYCTVRIKEIYRLQNELALLRSDLREMEENHKVTMNNLDYMIDDLQVTLYGEVVEHLKKLKPPEGKDPAWEANRDKSFRQRLDVLERSRLDTIDRLERIERIIRELR